MLTPHFAGEIAGRYLPTATASTGTAGPHRVAKMYLHQMSLPRVAARLCVGYEVAYRLATRGEFGPVTQSPSGRWIIPAEGVADYLRRKGTPAVVAAHSLNPNAA